MGRRPRSTWRWRSRRRSCWRDRWRPTPSSVATTTRLRSSPRPPRACASSTPRRSPRRPSACETAKRKAPDEKKYGDRPEPPPGDVKPAMRFPLADTADPNDFDRPRPARRRSPRPRPTTPPAAAPCCRSVRPPPRPPCRTGPSRPPARCPRALIGDEDDDEGKWAAFAAASPCGCYENTDWDVEEAHTFDDLSDDVEQPLGALDETERPMDEDFLTFDDLEVPDAAPPRRRRGHRRGSHQDPAHGPRAAPGPRGRPGPAPVREPGPARRPIVPRAPRRRPRTRP